MILTSNGPDGLFQQLTKLSRLGLYELLAVAFEILLEHSVFATSVYGALQPALQPSKSHPHCPPGEPCFFCNFVNGSLLYPNVCPGLNN